MPTRSEIMKNAKNGQKSDRKSFFSEFKNSTFTVLILITRRTKRRKEDSDKKVGDTFEIKERKKLDNFENGKMEFFILTSLLLPSKK
jgi:hypothetical protein